MTQHRVRVVVRSPWRDAVFALLGAPLRPWSATSDVQPGEAVRVVIDSDPQLLLVQPVIVGAYGELDAAIIEGSRYSTLTVVPDGSTDAPSEPRWDSSSIAFGHDTAAAARTLLASQGRCTGCWSSFDLETEAGRDAVLVRTVDEGDFPATLCTTCQTAMTEGGFETFLDYKFSRHPRCPRCDAQRTLGASFGMPVFPIREMPWVDIRGCVITSGKWTCGACSHGW